MRRLRVVVLRRAEQDLREAVEYIARHAPQAAQRWLSGMQAALRSLAVNPERWSTAPENGLAGLEIRQLIYRTKSGKASRALFIVAGDEVRVLRIQRPGQPILSEDELV